MSIVVELALEDENRLLSVCDKIYKTVGEQTKCSPKGVERSINTMVKRIWKSDTGHSYLNQMAGYELDHTPKSSEFLSILTQYIRQKR